MKIGYPCINSSIGCTAGSTFRLKNYTQQHLIDKVSNNLECLQKILIFNQQNELLFFRIGSDLIPFASHAVCTFDWQTYFQKELAEIGVYIKKHQFRISMHPDQFTLINAHKMDIVERSIAELNYHCDILDGMKLGRSAKVQIHVGGVYGDKEQSMSRFVEQYHLLPEKIKKRLVIENDDKSYSLSDCLSINQLTGIPILFDSFHHECLNNGEEMADALKQAAATWQEEDGLLMVDYSSQKKEGRKGSHTESINAELFSSFLHDTIDSDFDIMLEIKDKEKSAFKARDLIDKISNG